MIGHASDPVLAFAIYSAWLADAGSVGWDSAIFDGVSFDHA